MCLPLHKGERKAVLQRVRLSLCALGSRNIDLEAARKQRLEPSLLLSSLSAGLCSDQPLSILRGNGMGVMWCCRQGTCYGYGDIPTPLSSLLGLDEAVGCCEDPLWADEGPSAYVHRANF